MARRHQPRKKTKLDKAQCILLLIIGLALGSVFIFGMGYWNAAVDADDALSVTATYQGYDIDYSRGRNGVTRKRIAEVDLQFADHKELYVDGSCADDDLLASLDTLRKGDTLDMLVHPNGGSMLLSITADGETLLAFEDAMKRLTVERWCFFGIGVFCYLCAGVGAYYLITGKYRKYYR